MHIGFVTSHFPFHDAKSNGGIGTGIKNLSDALVQLGHQVSVFVYSQDQDRKFTENGVDLYQIRNVKVKGLSWYFTRKKIEKIVNSVAPDVLECPDWEGISSFINAKCPVVVRLNGSDAYFCYLDGRKNKFKNRFHEKRALQRADGFISVSQFTADLTNRIFGLNKPFTIIPNGINIDNFPPAQPTNTALTVLYVGGIIRKKGLLEIPHYYNKVIERFPQAQFVFIGKDMPDVVSGQPSTQQMMLELFSEAAKKNVVFKGSVPYDEVKNYINQATVCIFPSFAEALPLAWLEAMAMEKPLVASNIGWATEVIDDGKEGFLENPKQHDLYAEKIIAILADAALGKKLGVAARKKIIEKFSSEVVARDSVAYYEQLLRQYNGH